MRACRLVALFLVACGSSTPEPTRPQRPHAPVAPSAQSEADTFLEWYTAMILAMEGRASEASWASSTDVSERNTGRRVGAMSVYTAVTGNPLVITKGQSLLKRSSELDEITRRQLRFILLSAAEAPGTRPDLAERRVDLEARQSEILDGFRFCLERRGTECARPATANDLDRILTESRDLPERLRAWEASKEVGVPLERGILALRDVRNEVARVMGYEDFMSLQVADYEMTRTEMMTLLDGVLVELRPLFEQVHCWTRHDLARRYGQPVPRLLPAHWVGNRWGQSWPGLVEAANLDDLFESRQPPWIVQQAERFYVSMGFPELPRGFWERSDLYPVPPNDTRQKNSHASAWHMDLQNDVRSLMSVEPNARWFGTTHHELGHIYYYLAYTNEDVPPVLRRGANRAFHEAIGSLIGLVAGQPGYLRQIGVWPADRQADMRQWLLSDALTESIVFFPFAAGTMSHFENDLYAEDLSPEDLNRRWWQYVARYQGIEPPAARPERGCDACTKTHINDDPGQYYDYALAELILHQIHAYICREIVHADPHDCSYYGSREVGDYLASMLRLGATHDWRELLREKTGSDLSAASLLAYYQPLTAYLEEQNRGRECSLPE